MTGEDQKENNRRIRRAYDRAGQRYHDLFHRELEGKEFDRDILRRFDGLLGGAKIVFDAGCGPSGHIGAYLAACGVRVIGVDISETCILNAARLHRSMEFAAMDMMALGFRESSLDGILSYYSIIHTPKRFLPSLVKEYHRALRPGGILLAAVKQGEGEKLLEEFLSFQTKLHFAYFTRSEMQALLTAGGFKILSLEERDPYSFEIADCRIYAMGEKL